MIDYTSSSSSVKHDTDCLNVNIAYWEPRAYVKDYLWAECSNCNFRVEAYKAVYVGVSSVDYVATKYKFCPICGKSMRVHGESESFI